MHAQPERACIMFYNILLWVKCDNTLPLLLQVRLCSTKLHAVVWSTQLLPYSTKLHAVFYPTQLLSCSTKLHAVAHATAAG